MTFSNKNNNNNNMKNINVNNSLSSSKSYGLKDSFNCSKNYNNSDSDSNSNDNYSFSNIISSHSNKCSNNDSTIEDPKSKELGKKIESKQNEKRKIIKVVNSSENNNNNNNNDNYTINQTIESSNDSLFSFLNIRDKYTINQTIESSSDGSLSSFLNIPENLNQKEKDLKNYSILSKEFEDLTNRSIKIQIKMNKYIFSPEDKNYNDLGKTKVKYLKQIQLLKKELTEISKRGYLGCYNHLFKDR